MLINHGVVLETIPPSIVRRKQSIPNLLLDEAVLCSFFTKRLFLLEKIMKIIWNDQSVSWFSHASAYTGFHQKLADLLLKHITVRETLCDIGCGTGLVDLELSSHIGRLTCVDISPIAINALRTRTHELGLTNIYGVCQDASQLTGRWDTVISLFFGGHDFLASYYPLASHCFILGVHGSRIGEFGPVGHRVEKCSDVSSVKEYLDRKEVNYLFEEASLEFGQPFKSRAEAEAFIQAYSAPISNETLNHYLEEVLISTGDKDFPLYLPKKKKFGLFIIRKDENENL